jgi:hypothetical protein
VRLGYDPTRTEKAIRGAEGKRLTYKKYLVARKRPNPPPAPLARPINYREPVQLELDFVVDLE